MRGLYNLKIKKYLPVLFIILLALLLRTFWLDRVPVGLSNDELDYVLNAKSVFLSGSDLSGKWNPLSLKPIPSSFPQAELPALLLAPFIGPLDLNLLNVRLPYSFIGIGTVILLYFIGFRLFGAKEAVFIGVTAAINPWSIFFSRALYDVHLALFFYIFALFLAIKLKGWHILFVFIPLFLGFYSYIGFKLLFLPFAVILIFYSWFFMHKKHFSKQYFVLLMLCLALFIFYLITVYGQQLNRTNELFTPKHPAVIETVNKQRLLSANSPLSPILINKYTVFAKTAVEKYYGAFSPQFLFLSGDGKGEFSLRDHGVFYYTDALFLLIGFVALFRYKRSTTFLISSLILISPLPSVGSTIGISYAVRSLLLAPFFIILIGLGIFTLIENGKKYTNTKLNITVLALLYITLVINFLNIYFYRNPVYNSEASNLSGRLLSVYLHRNPNQAVILAGAPENQFKNYLFTTNSLNKSSINNIRQNFNAGLYNTASLEFASCADYKKPINKQTLILEGGEDCTAAKDSSATVHIVQLKDSGSIYKILNDKLCSGYKLKRYPVNNEINDFSLGNLSNQQFCETFIIKY